MWTWGTTQIRVLAIFALLPLHCKAQQQVIVSFDASTFVALNSPNLNQNTALNVSEPLVRSLSTSSDYTGPPVYGALHRSGGGLWTVATPAAGGLRIRFNADGGGSAATGLFLLPANNLRLAGTAAAATLDASEIVASRSRRLASARLRFVVEEGGDFFISQASPELFVEGMVGNQRDSFRIVQALSAEWYSYDPITTAEGVSAIGEPASPAFDNVGFVGFALFAVAADTDDASCNFGVRMFSVTGEAVVVEEETVNDKDKIASATVNAANRLQTIEGFGASTAWYTKRLLRRDDASELVAHVFRDLQLDLLRVRNVYQHEGFETDTASFVTVVAAAEATLGRPIRILLSASSPPGYLKSTGVAKGGGTLAKNNQTGEYRYEDYAQWWADSLDYFRSEGISVEFVSIQNEPNFEAKHDTCLLDPVETNLTAGYNTAFDAVYAALLSRRNDPDAMMPKMLGPESFNFVDLPEYIGNFTDASKFYGYAHHLYQNNVGLYPNALNEDMARFYASHGDKPLFQTEFTVLRENNETDLQRKLNLAVLMHNALTIEHVSAYFCYALYWAGATDQGLIDISDFSVVRYTPEYYAFKHFSAFVHTDWSRIAVQPPADKDLLLSAYGSPRDDKVTVVVISEKSFALTLNLTFVDDADLASGKVYRSSATEDCELVDSFVPNNSVLQIPGQSITTLVLTTMQPTPAPQTASEPSTTPTDSWCRALLPSRFVQLFCTAFALIMAHW
jgi:O-glycosyl hydrolase